MPPPTASLCPFSPPLLKHLPQTEMHTLYMPQCWVGVRVHDQRRRGPAPALCLVSQQMCGGVSQQACWARAGPAAVVQHSSKLKINNVVWSHLPMIYLSLDRCLAGQQVTQLKSNHQYSNPTISLRSWFLLHQIMGLRTFICPNPCMAAPQ